jgi:NADH dehydrogenase [ubiquinone] 1 alpha subcomplex assembly factor 7
MNALAQRIARMIRMQGPISVAQFMTMALHDPELGYYATHNPIGARGDFITAPEISQTFGELLGAWIVQAWRDQSRPAPARLVELGPGRGTLMADALRAARLDTEFLKSIEVVLIETSGTLREAQAEKLNGAPVGVRWLDRFDNSLADQPLFLLANEFFDALPIRQFVFTGRGWCERMVGVQENGGFQYVLSPMPLGLDVPSERGLPRIGDIYEVCPSGEAIVEQVASVISQKGGAALIADYGYAGAGFGETLQAVSQHKYADVFGNPGDSDFSSHVDFAALARTAERSGAKAYGPADQGALLQSLGIEQRAERLVVAHPDQRDTIASSVHRLISPQAMGTLFKASAIVPKQAPKPAGF